MQHYGSFFDKTYENADEDFTAIPWARLQPNNFLKEWLEKDRAYTKVKKGLVVGCGLGDDTELLQNSGYNVTAFDYADKAIEQCRNRHPNSNATYLQADLFELPKEWVNSYDFVFEAYTLQSLPNELRKEALYNITNVIKNSGLLLVVCFANKSESINPPGPPHPIRKDEIEWIKDLDFSIVHFEEKNISGRDEYFWVFKKEDDKA